MNSLYMADFILKIVGVYYVRVFNLFPHTLCCLFIFSHDKTILVPIVINSEN